MTKLSEIQEKDRKYIFHPCSQMKDFIDYPAPVIVKGEGVYLFDENGKKYIDAISSWWVNLFGHANKRINAAIKDQIDTLEHVIFANFTHIPAVELCEELTKVLPKNIEKFLFADNGSSSIEMALKLSFQYHSQTGNPQKTKFLSLENAYHGETIGALGVGDVDIFTKTYRPLINEAIKVKAPYYSPNLSDDELKKIEDECIKNMQKIVEERHNEIASFIVEPIVQGASGMKIYTKNFLKAIREITKKYNIHLIDDEIAMGFGRTGKMFACEHAGVEPDIITMSKGLTSGYYPMAILGITQKIYDAFYADYSEGKSFLHSHTYSGNPVGCRIACEVLKIFREENILEIVNQKAEYLRKKASSIFKDNKNILEYRQIGLIAALELRPLDGRRLGKEIYELATSKGVFIRPLGNTIYFMPPYIITEKEIDKILEVCLETIEEVYNK